MPLWRWPTLWGILRDGDPSAADSSFHAGRILDVLRLNILPANPLLVASDTSGVWLVNESGGPGIPLSWDWDSPFLECMAQGLFGPEHVYAGGERLHETDVTQPAPLLAWREIVIQDSNRRALATGPIHRIVVVGQRGTIVLACDFGVFWAKIPNPGGTYFFQPATGLPGLRYSGLAEGPATRILTGAWGTDLVKHFGIFHGDWIASGLDFKRSSIAGITDKMMLRTEIAACAGDRNFMYAVAGGGGGLKPIVDSSGAVVLDKLFGDATWQSDDLLLGVLKSADGGLSWNATGSAIVGSTFPLFGGDPAHDALGFTQGSFNLCVGVSPFHRELVAVGLRNYFISKDNGDNWFTHDHAALHGDRHALYFDPADKGGVTLYMGSDGGVASSPDLGVTWASQGNRQLPNLQFGTEGDGDLGAVSAASPHDSGVIAGSLQDNGNVYTSLYIDAAPWTEIDGGDGIRTVLVSSGHLVRENNDGDVNEDARAAEWDAAARKFTDLQMFPSPPLSGGVVPLDGSASGLTTTVMDLVRAPAYVNGDGESMVAVAAPGEAVHGLFATAGGKFHWQQLGTIPHAPDLNADGSEKPYKATAIVSHDGDPIYVGTNNGKIFRLNSNTPAWDVTDISDPIITPPVTAMAIPAAGEVYAVAGAGVFYYDLVKWYRFTGRVLPGGVDARLPAGETFVGVQVNRNRVPATIYVATSNGVWRSEDRGDTWLGFSEGLPTRPQCRDLRIAVESSGITFLYVSTIGWSLFRRILDWDEVLKPIQVDGHMDLVNRVAFGTDDWAHPAFSGTRSVGPLHPIEDMSFTEDDGDEIKVELKLHFEWKMDFTIVLTVNATLFDKEDHETDSHVSGSRSIPIGTIEHVVIDMASDEVWPDRAHIEFDVTY